MITGVGGGLGLVVRGATNPVFGLAICGRTISPTGLTIPPNGGIVNTTGDMVLTIPPTSWAQIDKITLDICIFV